MGGDLSRVVFVTYGNPVLTSGNTICAGGRDGFDVHPAFSANSTRLHQVSDYLGEQFLPKIKALATCEGSTCREPASESMTFVEAHQAAFANHGLCVRSSDDPEFDRACFSPNGDSFRTNPREAATDPLACGRPASEYRAYAPRARWIRTANDSYFTALTYPQGQSSILQPSNIHDATWGIMSAVYGGAIHPTAEGHAAMADATLPTMRSVLGLQPVEAPVHSEPLPPVNVNAPPRVPHPWGRRRECPVSNTRCTDVITLNLRLGHGTIPRISPYDFPSVFKSARRPSPDAYSAGSNLL